MTDPHATPASVLAPALPRPPHARAWWRRPHGSSLALAVASAARRHPGLVVAVARDTHGAHALEAELRGFADTDLPVLHLPDWETLPYDVFSPHPDIVSQRVATLYRLPATTRGVLVVPIATLMQRLRAARLHPGLQPRAASRPGARARRRTAPRLERAGYRHVPQVLEPGDYATRGALIDIFPMGAAEPYRIELFDDDIDTIRTFDPGNPALAGQGRPVQPAAGARVPARPQATSALPRACCASASRSIRGAARSTRTCAKARRRPASSTTCRCSSSTPKPCSTTSRPARWWCWATSALDAAEAFWAATATATSSAATISNGPVLPPDELYLPPQLLRERLNRLPRIEVAAAGNPLRGAVAGHPAPRPALPLHLRGQRAGRGPARLPRRLCRAAC